MQRSGRRLSVSTWSLKRTLERLGGAGDGQEPPATPENEQALLQLPPQLAAHGIHTLEICHFHLPSREPDYLAALRRTLEEAGIELWALLVDGGDITDPAHGARDAAWTQEWLPVAVALGAQRVRVSAGKQPPSPAARRLSIQRLTPLAHAANEHGLRLMTENWHALLSTPAHVEEILNALEGSMGLCVDFGNWQGPEKYAQLAAIMPYAESCHAKCDFDVDGALDEEDYTRCLDLTEAADFAGPYTLIYDGPNDDEWSGLAAEAELVAPYLTGSPESVRYLPPDILWRKSV